MNNQIGIISMQHARPFTAAHFSQLSHWKGAGFDFVELLVPEVGELDLPAMRHALSDEGLGVVLTARVNLDRNLASVDAAKRQAGVDYLRYCIDVAVSLGGKTLGGPLYGSPLVFAGCSPHVVSESERATKEIWCVEGLLQAGLYAQSAGIRLAVEPLNRFETDIINTTRQGVELVRKVNCPAVGLTLDTFHMNMEDDDIAGAFRYAGKHLFHMQANENHRGYLGTGHINWTDVIRALEDIEYDGSISLEPFRRTDERIGVPFAQWKPPQKDEQAQLRASCSFIKNMIALNGGRQ